MAQVAARLITVLIVTDANRKRASIAPTASNRTPSVISCPALLPRRNSREFVNAPTSSEAAFSEAKPVPVQLLKKEGAELVVAKHGKVEEHDQRNTAPDSGVSQHVAQR